MLGLLGNFHHNSRHQASLLGGKGRKELELSGAIPHPRCGHGETMLAPSSNHLAMPGSAAGGAGAALAGAAFASSTITGAAAVSAPAPPPAARFKCVSFMRHSIATHNEAAARSTDAMESVYLSEAYADSR